MSDKRAERDALRQERLEQRRIRKDRFVKRIEDLMHGEEWDDGDLESENAGKGRVSSVLLISLLVILILGLLGGVGIALVKERERTAALEQAMAGEDGIDGSDGKAVEENVETITEEANLAEREITISELERLSSELGMTTEEFLELLQTVVTREELTQQISEISGLTENEILSILEQYHLSTLEDLELLAQQYYELQLKLESALEELKLTNNNIFSLKEELSAYINHNYEILNQKILAAEEEWKLAFRGLKRSHDSLETEFYEFRDRIEARMTQADKDSLQYRYEAETNTLHLSHGE